jgi:hypothetical protein
MILLSKTVRDVLVRNVHRSSELHTDESRLYVEVGKEFASHKTVEHGSAGYGFYVGKDGQNTNAAENFFGNFKRSMKSTYRAFAANNTLRAISQSLNFGTTIVSPLALLTGNGRLMLSRVQRASA